MKKFLILPLSLTAALSLTAVAHADIIVDPPLEVEEPLMQSVQLLPWLLVGAAVGVTVYLLRKYWTKKK